MDVIDPTVCIGRLCSLCSIELSVRERAADVNRSHGVQSTVHRARARMKERVSVKFVYCMFLIYPVLKEKKSFLQNTICYDRFALFISRKCIFYVYREKKLIFSL